MKNAMLTVVSIISLVIFFNVSKGSANEDVSALIKQASEELMRSGGIGNFVAADYVGLENIDKYSVSGKVREHVGNALKSLKQAEKQSPDNLDVILLLGTSYARMQDEAETIKYFFKYVLMNGQNEIAYRTLIGLYYQNEEYRKAYEVMEKLAQINPNIKDTDDYQMLRQKVSE